MLEMDLILLIEPSNSFAALKLCKPYYRHIHLAQEAGTEILA